MSTTEPNELPEVDAERAFSQGFSEGVELLGRFNLAIVGDTGVGKSSLVNAIFGTERAETGMGKPIYKAEGGAEYFLSSDEVFGVWDFEGFEHGRDKAPKETLAKRLKENQKAGNDRHIHVAWFCWDASSSRVTDGHRTLIDLLIKAGIPVIGVLTKAHARGATVSTQQREFAQWIENENLGLADPRVYLTASVADEELGFDQYGLHELLDATVRVAPDAVGDAIARAQVIDANAKRDLAWKWIVATSGTAATVAATPIPIASSAVLTPLQLGLFGKIAAIYGLSIKSTVGSGAGMLQLGVAITGKTAAQSLVKLVPGVGSVINASVAAVWTAASGLAWQQVCEKIAENPDQERTFSEFMGMYGPAVQTLFTGWMRNGGKIPATAD